MKSSNVQTFTLPPSALKLFLGTMLGNKGMNNDQIKTTMEVLDKQLSNEKKNDEKISDEKTSDEKDISNNVLDSKKENVDIENTNTVKNNVLDSILENNKEIGNIIGSLISKSS
jgi:hypothetical protein